MSDVFFGGEEFADDLRALQLKATVQNYFITTECGKAEEKFTGRVGHLNGAYSSIIDFVSGEVIRFELQRISEEGRLFSLIEINFSDIENLDNPAASTVPLMTVIEPDTNWGLELWEEKSLIDPMWIAAIEDHLSYGTPILIEADSDCRRLERRQELKDKVASCIGKVLTKLKNHEEARLSNALGNNTQYKKLYGRAAVLHAEISNSNFSLGDAVVHLFAGTTLAKRTVK